MIVFLSVPSSLKFHIAQFCSALALTLKSLSLYTSYPKQFLLPNNDLSGVLIQDRS